MERAAGAAPLAERTLLNLGCGERYDPTAVNVDITSDTGPDVLHDLDVVPWPFEDCRFERVRLIDVLEHLKDPSAALTEIHRVTAPSGTVELVCPHFSSANAYSDLTHRGLFGYHSLDTFTGDSPHSYYTRVRFDYRLRTLHFHRSAANRVVQRYANWRPERYERRWTWMFPAWYMHWELTVRKDGAEQSLQP